MLSDFLDLPITHIQQNVVDTGGQDRRSQQYYSKHHGFLQYEHDANDILYNKKWFCHDIEHKRKVRRDVYCMRILSEFLPK